MPRSDISGFILAGGHSRRMGRDKSELPWGQQNFLTHAIGRMQQVCDEVFVVGKTAGPAVRNLHDEFPGDGPLAGIHSALKHSTTGWNVVLAVDMPLAPTALLQFIAAKCTVPCLVVVPQLDVAEPRLFGSDTESASAQEVDETPGILQPLCAAYHRGFLPLVERSLSNRELSIRRLLEQAAQGMMGVQPDAIRVIGQNELTSAGFSPKMLMNVNTPADLERAKSFAEHFHVD